MPINTKRPFFWGSAYVIVGIFFGVILIKGEMASWYRIQEMFHFQSFHMYGVLASAILVAAVSLALIKRQRRTALTGAEIEIPEKPFGNGVRYALGGTLFGIGWGLAGACPGPIFALIGNAIPGGFVLLLATFAGTFTYTRVHSKLPH
jgi:uncharacterized membrane protein YedE/YeeE